MKGAPHITVTIRRLLSTIPLVYEIGAAVKLVWLKLTYSGGDEIAAVTLIKEEHGLALDIGANRGQSAVRILKLKPGFKVISFEPNSRCQPFLKIARLLAGRALQYEMYGLSDTNGEKTYYEPWVHSLPVAAEGTFFPENLGGNVEQRIGPYHVEQSTFSTRTLDELALSPQFLKIDVQGAEVAVLRGARRTISRWKPVIVIERSAHNEDTVKQFLSELDYEQLSADAARTAGVMLGDLTGDNVFVFRGSSHTPVFTADH